MKPIRSSLPSSSWLVATVVPWLTAVIALPSSWSRPRTLRTPLRKPSAGSAGVDGVFVVVVWPVSSSTATTSVNVPPVSIPMRTRRVGALMGHYLSGEIPRPKDVARGTSGAVQGARKRPAECCPREATAGGWPPQRRNPDDRPLHHRRDLRRRRPRQPGAGAGRLHRALVRALQDDGAGHRGPFRRPGIP